MSSMIDVLTRVDAICKKYERYDADKHHRNDADPFVEKSARAAKEKNRAASVTLNTDVQRTKAEEEVVKLHKIAASKVKGLSPEEKVLRSDLVAALPPQDPGPSLTATRTPAGIYSGLHSTSSTFRFRISRTAVTADRKGKLGLLVRRMREWSKEALHGPAKLT